MKTDRMLTVICTALALGAFGTTARAGDGEMSVRDMMKHEQMDRNKDRMVSRSEFLEMMGKVWDMKAKEMKLEPRGASAEQMQQILQSLYSTA